MSFLCHPEECHSCVILRSEATKDLLTKYRNEILHFVQDDTKSGSRSFADAQDDTVIAQDDTKKLRYHQAQAIISANIKEGITLFRKENKKGFTLIEMLVVIAIIAILVAIIVPTVISSTKRADASTDAANLRSILGEANIAVFNGEKMRAVDSAKKECLKSKSYPDAKLMIVYTMPGFVEVFYVDGDQYYGLDYFTELAEKGSTSVSTERPVYPANYNEEWFSIGAVDPNNS